MNTWFLLIPIFVVLSAGSFCTYCKTVRDSWMYLPAFIIISLLTGWLWVTASRRLDSTSNILLFSLLWDILMVTAYYAGPLLLKGEGFSWQVYAASAVTLAGVIWLKMSLS
jgi:hypothetical protein